MKRSFLPFTPRVGVGCFLVLLLLAASLFAWNKARKQWAIGVPVESVAQRYDTSNDRTSVWTQFRGPDQGRCTSTQGVPLVWSERTNVAWKSEVPGVGFSSPIVSEDKLWVTTALQEGRSLRVVALDKASGKRLLDQEIFNLTSSPTIHKVNSHASPTPVLAGEQLFVAFGSHGMASLRTSDGHVLWKNTSLKFDDEKMGGGASPIVAGDFVIVHCDGADERFIVALNKFTGEVAWKTPRSNPIAQAIPFRKAFSTPLLHDVGDVRQLISSSSFRLFGYDPTNGRELWSVELPGFCPVPVPLVEADWIFVCTGYEKAQLWAFQAQQSQGPPRLMWKTMRSVPLVSSPVMVDKYIYLVSDNGIASCLEASSGRLIWNERIGGTCWASLLCSQGRIYCFAEDGTTTVLAASTQFKVLAKNRLDGQIMATPAAAGDALFLRTKTHLYRLQGQARSVRGSVVEVQAGIVPAAVQVSSSVR